MKKIKYKLNFLILTFLLLSCEQKANQVVQIINNPSEQSPNNKSLPVKETNDAPISSTQSPPLVVEALQKPSPTPIPTPKATPIPIPSLDEETVRRIFKENFDSLMNDGVSTYKTLEDIISVEIYFYNFAPKPLERCTKIEFLFNGLRMETRVQALKWIYSSTKGWLINSRLFSSGNADNPCASSSFTRTQ